MASSAQLTYQDALANLNKGGLTGNTLSMAQTSLKNAYGTASPGATAPTGTAITTPTSSPQSNVTQPADTATQPIENPAPANPSYQSALDSYLSALGASNTANETSDKASIAARKGYLDTLDAPGGLKAGAEASAALFNRNANANIADLAVGQNAATNASQLALERLKYEQGLLPKPGESFNLSPGESRYDAKGNLIASSAPKAPSITDQYGSGSIGEYNFAKSQGYTGSFSQYQNEDANRKAVIAKAGTSSSTAPKTLEERNQVTAGKVASLFSPGYTIPGSNGTPYVDANGLATPEGWKTALTASGLTRSDFIKQFGYLLYNDAKDGIPSSYGLTAAEKKLITG